MDFGFSNDDTRHAAGTAWRDAAVADGWSIRPTYVSEAVERAATLDHPDGYKALILTRTLSGPKWKFETSIAIWGPDGLAVKPPNTYDMNAIRAGARTCNYCGKTDCDTVRVGFAGRACVACQPGEEKKLGPRYYD